MRLILLPLFFPLNFVILRCIESNNQRQSMNVRQTASVAVLQLCCKGIKDV